MVTGADEQTREAFLYLSAVAERPTASLWDLVDAVGPREAVAMIRAGRVGAEVRRQTEARRDGVDPDRLRRAGEASGARFLVPGDPDWPAAALAPLDLPRARGTSSSEVSLRPFGLWWAGPADPPEIARRSAAIVGSRAPTTYGKHVAADTAFGCAVEGVAVVSGAAFGIDTSAHRGCLAAGGTTVAVLACGIDHAYPRANEDLIRRIAADGAVVSPYPPGATVARFRFLDRNRLIAGLSSASVVVEAGARSGALSTAAWARNLGRPVGAVPGPVTSATSVGTLRLIREHDAVLVRGADDVLELAGSMGEGPDEEPTPATAWDALDDRSRRVLEAVPVHGGAGPDEIAGVSGVPVPDTRVVLGLLLAEGVVRRDSAGFSRDADPSGQLRLV